MALMALGSFAQSEDVNVDLGEVVVNAAQVVRKVDGMSIYPKVEQKEASTNGYGLLRRLSLPNIRVDEVSHSVTAIDERGGIQIRINGIVASVADMISLEPMDVKRIDFIDNPGVRYGEGIAYVVDIIVDKSAQGYSVGCDLTSALTSTMLYGTVFGGWNSGKSRFDLSYDGVYTDSKGNRTSEIADYTLNDASVKHVVRDDLYSRYKNVYNNVQLKYSLADSSSYVFQSTFRTYFDNTPTDNHRMPVYDGNDSYEAFHNVKTHGIGPAMDLYYSRKLNDRQSLTIDATGSYIRTKSAYATEEIVPFDYDVDGKVFSLNSEAVYELKLPSSTFSAGINHMQKYTENLYSRDVSSCNKIQTSNSYAFSELKGRAGAFDYSAGLGLSYLHYSQENHKYHFWLFRPKATITYSLTNALQLQYIFEQREHVSQVAMISDAMIRKNSMEWTVGSPDITPNKVLDNTMRLSYTGNRLQSSFGIFYDSHPYPNMAVYERTSDDRFLYSQKNQKRIEVLLLQAYSNYWLVPEHLSVMGMGGLFRCFNFGDDYTHCYTSYIVQIGIDAYFDKFSFSLSADNGNRFLEGETKGCSGYHVNVQASYRLGNCQFSLTWQNPFDNKYRQDKTEILNRYLHKVVSSYSKDEGNMVVLNVVWRINGGKKYHNVQRKAIRWDNETGIMQ